MNATLVENISDRLRIPIQKATPISGGDISQAYIIENSHGKVFCKINYGDDAYDMFLAEKEGLEVIAETQTVKAPKVFACDDFGEGAFLAMEYIESKRNPSSDEFAELGRQLARMHRLTCSDFGWSKDNFIGSLPQVNQQRSHWDTFFVEQRLFPQLTMAIGNGMLAQEEVPDMYTMLSICEDLFEDIEPSLIHGDLWNGNFLISTDGLPYLIDPAFYYGHKEVDLAMTRLFGGFGEAFYEAYYGLHSHRANDCQRNDLYQLYYLLVHLNLFGSSYYPAVKKILRRYFG